MKSHAVYTNQTSPSAPPLGAEVDTVILRTPIEPAAVGEVTVVVPVNVGLASGAFVVRFTPAFDLALVSVMCSP